MTDLYAALQPVLDEQQAPDQQPEVNAEEKQRAVQLAIMGLPNVVCCVLLHYLWTIGTVVTAMSSVVCLHLLHYQWLVDSDARCGMLYLLRFQWTIATAMTNVVCPMQYAQCSMPSPLALPFGH